VITGDDAVVQRVNTRQCDDIVIEVRGDRAFVTKCSFVLNEDSWSIIVNGKDAHVSLNRFTDCDQALSVIGDGALVELNKWSHCGGLAVSGDGLTVRRNVIAGAPNDQTGLDIRSRTAAGGGVIEDNKVTDTSQSGLSLACNNATVRRNRVSGAGTESGESACLIAGDGNTVSDVVIARGGTHGFDVSGAGNTLTRCTSTDNAADGFHVGGDGNTLTDCKAALNSGEGLDNEGANTTATGCTFTDNRIDVANGGSLSNASTFAAANTFKTGGTTQAQQVD
jgi:hypothetical protein